VLGQLGNRVQHALRAFTPRDQKAVKAAAQTFRANPKLKVEQVILEMGVGEALISTLDEKGTPGVVERAFVCPPASQIGPIAAAQRQEIIRQSLVFGQYEKMVDRESAYERLKARSEPPPAQIPASVPQQSMPPMEWKPPQPAPPRSGGRQPMSVGEAVFKSVAVAAGSQLGRSLIRGVLGSLMGGSTRSRRRY
jgi:hypothetical protein